MDGTHPRGRTRARWRMGAACLLALACALLALAHSEGTATGASGSVVVSANIGSSTTVDPAACQSNTAGVTGFGTVLPGTNAVTGTDCTVRFGSSNDTASLRLRQADARGVAMWSPPESA